MVALALGVAVLIPAAAAFAEGESGGADHGILMASAVFPADSTNVGVVSGSDRAPLGPYSDQRLDNREN
ncbi:MAG TPA: hypothetical protein VJT32_01185 [bacterium]|nr:hypothetical protein [bacterium]